MATNTPIFTLKVPAYKSDSHSATEGSFVLTQPAPKIYLLSFSSPPENRLSPPFLDTFTLALDIILTTLPPGVLMTTSSFPKFYSNGIDYPAAIAEKPFMTTHLYPVWRKLLTFPMPTVSIINGHNFGAGLMTSMSHDYRIMNPHKGFLCLPEVDMDAPLPSPMAAVFRYKLPMSTFRTLILEGKRFNALAALEAGIIDSVGGVEEGIKLITDLKLTSKLRPLGKGSFGLVKEEIHRDLLKVINLPEEHDGLQYAADKKDRDLRLEVSRKNVEKWKKEGGQLNEALKSKL